MVREQRVFRSDADITCRLSEALKTHQEDLNEHLRLWEGLSAEINDRSRQLSRHIGQIQSCISNTKIMLAHFEDSHNLLHVVQTGGANAQKHPVQEELEADLSVKCKKQKRGHDESETVPNHDDAVGDVSGLFTIDTKPMTQAELEEKTLEPQKGPEYFDRRPGTQKVSARPKRQASSNSSSGTNGGQQPGSNVAGAKRRKTSAPGKSEPQVVEADEEGLHYAELERKVDIRLKQEDEASSRKANKKRKRESERSMRSTTGVSEQQTFNSDLAEHIQPDLTPKQKRKKAYKDQISEMKKMDPNVAISDFHKALSERQKLEQMEANNIKSFESAMCKESHSGKKPPAKKRKKEREIAT